MEHSDTVTIAASAGSCAQRRSCRMASTRKMQAGTLLTSCATETPECAGG
ncbi:MAG: hypothetical protein AAF601_03170 [Pseudomonadota bacterium]